VAEAAPASQERGRSLVAATASTLAANLVVAVLALVNVLVQSRGLGADGRGAVVLLMNVAGLTANVTAIGIQEANANMGAADPRSRPALATNSALFALVIGAASAALVLGLADAFPRLVAGVDLSLVLAAVLMVPVLLFQTYLTFLVRSAYHFGVANACWVTGGVIATGGTVVLYLAGALTVWSSFGVWAAGQAVGTAILVVDIVRTLGGFGRPDPARARRALSFGGRAHIGFVMNVGNTRLDQWIVGGVAGTRELGLYSVAVSVSEVLFYLPTTLVWVQRPSLVRARAEEAARQAARVARVTLTLTVPLTLGLVLLAPFAIPLVFGDEFEGAIDDLQILSLGVFGIILLRLLANALAARDRPGLQSIGIAVAFAATVILDIALIPPFGGAGAAAASLVAYTVGGVVTTLVFRRVLGVGLRELVPRPRDVRELTRAVRDAMPVRP